MIKTATECGTSASFTKHTPLGKFFRYGSSSSDKDNFCLEISVSLPKSWRKDIYNPALAIMSSLRDGCVLVNIEISPYPPC